MRARAAVAWAAGKPLSMETIGIDDLTTHTMPLERIDHGFEPMEGGESIRSVAIYRGFAASLAISSTSQARKASTCGREGRPGGRTSQ